MPTVRKSYGCSEKTKTEPKKEGRKISCGFLQNKEIDK